MELLTDLVASYLFEKPKDLLNQTTYHDIYHDDFMVVIQDKEYYPIDKVLVCRFSTDIGQGGGQPIPTFKNGDMDKQYETYPLCLEGDDSNHIIWLI